MNQIASFDAARATLRTASASPQQLRYVVESAPEYMAEVAVHANVDVPLREWLWSNGGSETRRAMVDQFYQHLRMIDAAGLPVPAAAEAYQLALNGSAKQAAVGMGTFESGSPTLLARNVPADNGHDGPKMVTETCLVTESGDSVVLWADTVVMGRGPFDNYPAHVQVVACTDPEQTVSKVHACLQKHQGEWFVTDMDSTNGVWVSTAEGTVAAGAGQPVAVEGRFFLGSYALDLQRGEFAPEDESVDAAATVLRETGGALASIVFDDGTSTHIYADCVLLGRNPDTSAQPHAQILKINDTARCVSKTHARLDRFNGTWFITDLGSTNGVSVDGRRLSPNVASACGRVIDLGGVNLELLGG